jgi:nucleoside-diphosphate-sugar epimerase
MLYMPDAIRATLELMDAPKEKISIRTSYNLSGMSFAPCDLAAEISKYIPEFQATYAPDYRDIIASSWPASIKDEPARKDWGWQSRYDLKSMTQDMLPKLRSLIGILPEKTITPAPYPDFLIHQ